MTRIVIIEDHPVLVCIYRNKFIAEGYQVEIASDGQSGLELVRRIRPNLVVLDLAMPKVNGLEVLKKLRADPSFRGLPVIIFSDSAWKQQALQEGATVVLSKSKHTPSQVVEAVRTALMSSESLLDEAQQTGNLVPVSTSDARATQSEITKGRILLVEDHYDLRTTISASLVRSGFHVTGAECHSAAWDQIKAGEFDAYLVNRVCPDGLGLALCRKLRHLYEHKPIVLYSTVTIPFSAEQRFNAGASAYLSQAAEILNPGGILSQLIDEARSTSSTGGKRKANGLTALRA